MIDFFRDKIIKYNENKTRPHELFLQHKKTKCFYTYAVLEPCDVIARYGFEIGVSEAILQKIIKDEWGCWLRTNNFETCPAQYGGEKKYFNIIEGGNYNVKYDPSKILNVQEKDQS